MLKRRITRTTLALAAVAAGALVLASCTKQGFGSGAGNCDYLVLPGFADGGTTNPFTLAQCPEDVLMDIEILVEFRAPDGGAGEIPPDTALSSFLVRHYDVTYRNLNTGGSVPGVDVPFPFHQAISPAPLPPPAEFAIDDLPLLTSGQKEVAPLNRADFYPPGGVALEATITWWGHPAVDQEAWCFGSHYLTIRIDRTADTCF